MTEKIAKLSMNNLEEEFIFGKVAQSANGSVLYRQKKAVILATVTMERKRVKKSFCL
jgi:polyribonucleotide nucleotidyltransferase